jgi:hypothetical protein
MWHWYTNMSWGSVVGIVRLWVEQLRICASISGWNRILFPLQSVQTSFEAHQAFWSGGTGTSCRWRVARVWSWLFTCVRCQGLNEWSCSFTAPYAFMVFTGMTLWGTAVTQWLRYCATNRKVTGSIPDGVIGIFHWHFPCDRTMALGSTQPLTEMSTRSISWW